MTAPDKIWAWQSSTKPQGVSLAGGKVDDQIEYTRSDLIAARAVKSLGTLAMNDEGGLYLTDQPDNSLVAVAVRDADMPWRRAHPDVIDAIVERFNAPALHPASPLGAVRLYLDLDGVMADFDAHYPAEFGQDHKSMADDDMWAKINAHPSYFEDMPLCPGAADFFAEIRQLKPIILTACPRTNYAHVAGQKRRWVHKHLGKELTVLPVMGGHNKHLFMHAPGDILIDDYEKNCAPWRKSGGFAILHTSFDATRAALAAIAPFTRKGW